MAPKSPRRPIRLPPPAFVFFGVLGRSAELVDLAGERIVSRFGALHPDGRSDLFEFPDTVAYEASMGHGLVRRFFVIHERLEQDRLAPVKLASIDIENEIRDHVRDHDPESEHARFERPVNVDPGLINDCRIVLATTKNFSHRLYRGDGIWEEITLVWKDGEYRSLPWTYPDFTRPEYHRFFERFRDEFLGRR